MQLEGFIKTQIESVDDLRALLLLSRNPQGRWDAIALAARLYVPPAAEEEALARLAKQNLVVGAGNPPRYHYQLQSSELAKMVSELAEMNRKQPVTLINLVHANAKARDLQAFAAAFKLKREKG